MPHNHITLHVVVPHIAVLQVLLKWLRALLPVLIASSGNILLVKWLCICLGKLTDNQPEIARAAFDEGAADLLAGLLTAQLPELRAAAVFGLGSLMHSIPGRTIMPDGAGPAAAAGTAAAGGSSGEQLQYVEIIVGSYLAKGNVVYDASPLVRGELAVAYARLVRGAGNALSEAVYLMQDTIAQQQRKHLELLRRQQLHQQQQRQAANEEAAAAAGGSIRRSTSGNNVQEAPSTSAAGSTSSESTAVPTSAAGGQQQQQQQQQNGSWGSAGSGPESSPGKLGNWAAELDGPADAAVAVGGMSDSTAMLFMVLEQVLLLATDPSVKVRTAGCPHAQMGVR